MKTRIVLYSLVLFFSLPANASELKNIDCSQFKIMADGALDDHKFYLMRSIEQSSRDAKKNSRQMARESLYQANAWANLYNAFCKN